MNAIPSEPVRAADNGMRGSRGPTLRCNGAASADLSEELTSFEVLCVRQKKLEKEEGAWLDEV